MTPGEWAYFTDQPLSSEETFKTPDHWTSYKLGANRDLGDGWDGYGERRWYECEVAVLASWTERYPGTRPSQWWRFSTPEEARKGEASWQYLDRLGLWLEGERERAKALGLKPGRETCRTPLHPDWDRRGRDRPMRD